MADRRYKLLKQGLPGTRSFEVADLVAGDTPQWNATTEVWDAVSLGDTYYTETEVDALFTNYEPDTLYAAGAEKVTTQQFGASVHGDASDTATYIQLLNNADSPLAIWAVNPTEYYLYGYQHGARMTLYAEDAGGTSRVLLRGDPDDTTTIHYQGNVRASTTSEGLSVGNSGDVTPTGSAVGQLTLNGNAYAGFIALNATGMYVGHNSGARSLNFMVDETVEYTISSAGFHTFYHNGTANFLLDGTYMRFTSTSSTSPYFEFYGNSGGRDMYFQAASDAAYYWRGNNNGAYFYMDGPDAGGTNRIVLIADPDNYTDIYARDYLGIRVGNGTLGFYNNSGTTKQTVSGSRGGNAALASLLSALANIGLITNSTT